MNERDREILQNTVRVGINLGVLLDVGLFPGKHALGIEECKGFVKSVVEDAQGRLQSLTPPPVAPPAPAVATPAP